MRFQQETARPSPYDLTHHVISWSWRRPAEKPDEIPSACNQCFVAVRGRPTTSQPAESSSESPNVGRNPKTKVRRLIDTPALDPAMPRGPFGGHHEVAPRTVRFPRSRLALKEQEGWNGRADLAFAVVGPARGCLLWWRFRVQEFETRKSQLEQGPLVPPRSP